MGTQSSYQVLCLVCAHLPAYRLVLTAVPDVYNCTWSDPAGKRTGKNFIDDIGI